MKHTVTSSTLMKRIPFSQQRGKCEALGAWLVQVETEAENNFIVSHMDTYFGNTHSEFWIDLSSPPGSKSL